MDKKIKESTIIIAIAFVFLFVPLNVYAPHVDDLDYSNELGYEGKEPIRVYTIFASQTYSGCGEYDQDKLDFFKRFTGQILSQYDFLPIRGNGHECVLVSGNVDFNRNGNDNFENYGLTLDDTLEKARNWHPDLTIIIFDNKLSRQYFEQTKEFEKGQWTYWGGHIEGKSNTIVSTSSLNEIEVPEDAWILSHELAHFALRYYDEPRSVWVNYVHNVHDDYRECQKTQFRENFCLDTYSTVKGYAGNFKILKPYEKSIPSEPICTTGTILKNGICVVKEEPEFVPVTKDSDGDGILDMFDYCVTQRENFNGYQDEDGCPDNIPKSTDNSITIKVIQEVRNNIQYLQEKFFSISFMNIDAVVLKNMNLQNSLNSLKSEKNSLDSRFSSSYEDIKVANDLYHRGQYGESLYYFRSIEDNLYKINFEFNAYAKNLKELTNKDISLFQESNSLTITSTPEKATSNSQNDKTIGEIMWLEDTYPSRGTGVVRIIDQDMDLNLNQKDSFDVDVWSDSDTKGIELIVLETRKSSGIFEATIFFTTDKSSSPKLKIAVDDIVTAEYEDKTLPAPYTTTDELDITAITLMTEPNCDVGTVLIDHVCQEEKIESSKDQFCFLWWCW